MSVSVRCGSAAQLSQCRGRAATTATMGWWRRSTCTPYPSTSSSSPSVPSPLFRRCFHVRSSLWFKKKVLHPPPPTRPSSPPQSSAVSQEDSPAASDLPTTASAPSTGLSSFLPSPSSPSAPRYFAYSPLPSFLRGAPRRRPAAVVARSEGKEAMAIKATRKRDDTPSDPSYDWRMGILIERLPRLLNRTKHLSTP